MVTNSRCMQLCKY